MRRHSRLWLLTALLGMLTTAPARDLGAEWGERFALRDLAGAPVARDARWVVLVFLSPECPVANANLPVLNALAQEFAVAGAGFVGVYADPSLTPATLRAHTADYHLFFPTVDDREQRLARATGAAYTPEAFVYSREGRLLHRGRIDDRVQGFGAAKPAATHEDLRDVLAALVAGNPAPATHRPGFGCTIPGSAKPELCGGLP